MCSSRLVTREEPDFGFRTHLTRPMPHPDSFDMRRPETFRSHDLISAGVFEPVPQIECEQPRDDMLQAVPQGRSLRSFIIEH